MGVINVAILYFLNYYNLNSIQNNTCVMIRKYGDVL